MLQNVEQYDVIEREQLLYGTMLQNVEQEEAIERKELLC